MKGVLYLVWWDERSLSLHAGHVFTVLSCSSCATHNLLVFLFFDKPRMDVCQDFRNLQFQFKRGRGRPIRTIWTFLMVLSGFLFVIKVKSYH